MRLQGKTALVTAAGQGIGRASVLAMAAQGAQVLATDVNPALLAAYEGFRQPQGLPATYQVVYAVLHKEF